MLSPFFLLDVGVSVSLTIIRLSWWSRPKKVWSTYCDTPHRGRADRILYVIESDQSRRKVVSSFKKHSTLTPPKKEEKKKEKDVQTVHIPISTVPSSQFNLNCDQNLNSKKTDSFSMYFLWPQSRLCNLNRWRRSINKPKTQISWSWSKSLQEPQARNHDSM